LLQEIVAQTAAVWARLKKSPKGSESPRIQILMDSNLRLSHPHQSLLQLSLKGSPTKYNKLKKSQSKGRSKLQVNQ